MDDIKTSEWEFNEDKKDQWDFDVDDEASEDEIEAAEWIDEFPAPPQIREIRLEDERRVEQSLPQEESIWKSNEAEAWNPDEEAARDIVESWICDIPAPLKTTESQGSEDTLQASPLEYVKAWVESWSSEPRATGMICTTCHGKVTVERRVTVS